MIFTSTLCSGDVLVEGRQIEIGDADFSDHQFVQQGLEQLVEHRAFLTVQLYFAINRVEDRDDFPLLVQVRDRNSEAAELVALMFARPTARLANFFSSPWAKSQLRK